MGQQQLLLLVLSTVIVGLATVAGIQAFDEGQTQAAQDALTQRAIAIGTDITAALNKPSQLGGITTSSNKEQIATAAGLDDSGGTAGEGIPATGAGDSAYCDISSGSSDTDPITINCQTNDSESQTVTVSVDESGASITTINGTNLGSI